jgi:hypothetical protein
VSHYGIENQWSSVNREQLENQFDDVSRDKPEIHDTCVSQCCIETLK